ncbi:MAG: linear amide C-N hydrolase [Gammaproteobacteria bacterium]
MRDYTLTAIGTIILSLMGISSSLACTDFRLTAQDGTVLITRTMEHSDLHSNLRSSTRGRIFQTTAPDGKPGLTWKATYGYVFMDGLNVDASLDGMNEAGLSFEALYLPDYAQYQEVPSGHDDEALPYLYIGDWILSNFKTVDEVKEALNHIFLYGNKIPGMGDMIYPLHYAVYDASGKGLVIEYVNGKLNLHDNAIGVLTNSPPYDWHLTNLKNYIHLRPVNPTPVQASGITFAAAGVGYGMVGLPGDISPPSRFVKMAVLKDVALPAKNSDEVLTLAQHIINNVDIPLGLVRIPENNTFTTETTEWTVFKDLTHKVLYYRSYEDFTIHAVNLSQVDFSEKAQRLKMPMASKAHIEDVTNQFLKSIP